MDLSRELTTIDRLCYGRAFSEDEERWVSLHDPAKRAFLVREMIDRKRRIEATNPAELTYEEFLDTEYWRWLSKMLKGQAMYTCQRCGFRGFPIGTGLEVHHKTYEHRGHEYPDHLEDLIVLCSHCHRAQHPNK